MDIVLSTQIEDFNESALKIFASKPTLAVVGDKLEGFSFNDCETMY